MLVWFLVFWASGLVKCEAKESPSNVVLIIADDMGWDDVSFHGSNQILTPNIDLLAYTGVALERYYTHCVCTPSRTALLTGKYAYTLGMQGYPLTNGEDRGLPITEKILPQYLKERGYATHLVGKWHVGHSRVEYLPTKRGFDSHFGHRGGYMDYYEYTIGETWTSGEVFGLDLYRNMTADWDSKGYITDLYNQEAKSIIMHHNSSIPLFLMVGHNAPHAGNDAALLQAPPEEVRAMRHVESPGRRIYAAMVKKLDDSVGDIVKALYVKGILENTVIAFASDNGGITQSNRASNRPLRGTKMSPFEGGLRVPGLVWSSKMNCSNHLWKGYMHVSDWLPTLIRAAGFKPPTNIDGIDHWSAIIENKESDRQEMFEIDDYSRFSSIIYGDYKLVAGDPPSEYSHYYGRDLNGIIGKGLNYTNAVAKSHVYSVMANIGKPFNMSNINIRNDIKLTCSNETEEICFPSNGTICLYNIKSDPCETKDISTDNLQMVSMLQARLETEMKRLVPRIKPIFRDPKAAPSLHNYTWSTWI